MRFEPAPSFGGGAGNGPEGRPQIAGHLDGDHILAPLLTTGVPALTDQLRVGASLARATDATLQVVNPVTGPDQTSLERYRDHPADDEEALLKWAVEQVAASVGEVDRGFVYTRGLLDGVLDSIRTNDVDTLVVPSGSASGRVRRGLIERLATHADCDVVTVNGRGGFEKVPSILLPVAGGPHSGLAADVARQIAADCGAWIDVLHVVDEDASDRERADAEEYVEAAYQRIARPETTTRWMLEAENVTDAVIEQSAYYGLTVIGAPTKGRLHRFISGSTNRAVRDNARSVVLSVRNNRSSERR